MVVRGLLSSTELWCKLVDLELLLGTYQSGSRHMSESESKFQNAAEYRGLITNQLLIRLPSYKKPAKTILYSGFQVFKWHKTLKNGRKNTITLMSLMASNPLSTHHVFEFQKVWLKLKRCWALAIT